MNLYTCRLTFHDVLFYETRTMGRLYETGRLLHNIALCYALGLAQTTYHHENYVPRYADELAPVTERGIYVTPAAGVDVAYSIHTFKFGDEQTSVKMEPSNVNLPTFGRAKEIAVGSRFAFAVLSESPLDLPRWVRMGLWMGKAGLEVSGPFPMRRLRERRTETLSTYPVNPADLPPTATVRLFDLVSMRPSSLLENALIEADDWWQAENLILPAGLKHRIA